MSADFGLEGRRALVTGATGRIGSAIAAALAGAGAEVILTGRSAERLAEVSDAIGGAESVEADLTNSADLDRLFEAVAGSGLDILVNNAGIANDAPLDELTREKVDEVLAVNVGAVLECSRRAVPLLEAGGGKIVNIGSIYGSVAPDARIYDDSPEMVRASLPYIASKGALVSITRDLAVRLAPLGIQVNLMSPGGVFADQPEAFVAQYEQRTPAGRMAVPDDLVGTAVYLASSASDYVTGQNIVVDGGFTAW